MTLQRHPNAHPAPPGGWVFDPQRLVPAETQTIRKILGVAKVSEADPFEMSAYTAVALARRSDPTIPWDAALYISAADIVHGAEESVTAEDIEAYKAKVAETDVTGGDPGLDPA